MAEEELNIVIEAHAEGMDAIRDVKDGINDVRNAMLELEATRFQNVMAQALAPVTALGGGFQNLTSTVVGAIPWIGNFLTTLGGIPVVGPIIALVLAAIAVQLVIFTAGIIPAIAAVATLVAVSVAGFAAIGLAAGLALGPLVLLGGAVVMLADRLFTTGKILTDPLLGLETNLGKMADTWGAKALPMAVQIIDFLNQMIPAVQSAGLQVLTWFGGVLPNALRLAQNATAFLSNEFNVLFPLFVKLNAEFMARLPAMGPLFREAFNAGVEAVKGLLENLLRFVDWFMKEWPKLEPIVRQVMDQAGRFIQGFGEQARRLVDWFIANWPQISKLLQDLKPVIDAVGNSILFLGRALEVSMGFTEFAIRKLGDLTNAVYGVASAYNHLRNALGPFGGMVPGIALPPNPASNFPSSVRGLQHGGIVPGGSGSPQMIMAHGGEAVISEDQLMAIISLLGQIVRNTAGSRFSTQAYAGRA